MTAAPKAELRDLIRSRLDGHLSSADEAADAVMALFNRVHADLDEVETTSMGAPREQRLWTRWIIASHAAESGTYEGKPRV